MINTFFFENGAVYEIMSQNMVEPEGPQMTSQCGPYELHTGQASLHARMGMHTRAHTHTHTIIYVIFVSFPRQQ